MYNRYKCTGQCKKDIVSTEKSLLTKNIVFFIPIAERTEREKKEDNTAREFNFRAHRDELEEIGERFSCPSPYGLGQFFKNKDSKVY